MMLERTLKSVLFSLPILSVLIIVFFWWLDLVTYAIFALYALIVMTTAPSIIFFSDDIKKNSYYNSNKTKILTIVLSMSLPFIIYGSYQYPRPMLFFVILSILLAFLIFGVYLNAFTPHSAMISLFLINFIYFVSTTSISKYYIGSGDTIIIWVMIYDTLSSGSLSLTAGYDSFPSFFSIVSQVGIITGTDAHLALVLTGAVLSSATLYFVYFFSRYTARIDKRISVISSAFVLLMYAHHYEGLYMLPRSFSYQLSIIILSIGIGFLLHSGRDQERYLFVGIIVVPTLMLSHKAEQLVSILFISLFVVVSICLKYRMNLNVGYKDLRNYKSLTILLFISLVIFLYVISGTPVPMTLYNLVFTGFISGSSSGGTGGSSVINPVPFAMMFIGSSIIAFLFITSLYVVVRSELSNLYSLLLISIFAAVFFFPGPLHMADSISFRRMAKYAVPFISVFCAIGLVSILSNNGLLSKILFAVLLITSGVFGFANDMYSRDNPIETTDTFSNYLTPSDIYAVNHIADTSNEQILADIRTHMYINRFQTHTRLFTEESITLTIKEDVRQYCGGQLYLRGEGLNTRESVVYPSNDNINLAAGGTQTQNIYNKTEFKHIDNSSIIYDNNEVTVYDINNCELG